MSDARSHTRDEKDLFAAVDLLPDPARASGPWRQIIRDFTASAPLSHWASRVTTTRIRCYDQIRVFLTRALLLAGLAGLLALAPGTTWLTWGLLLPALNQVLLEIYLDFVLNAPERAKARVIKAIAEIADSAHNETLVNVTGVLGMIAVPANIVAVCYFSGPGEPSWVKVVALSVAAAYGVSAILSFLTDATHYSAQQEQTRPYRLFRAVRPHSWFVICVLMTAIVAGSIIVDRWAPVMEPLAWALCAFPLLIGSRQRDYERFLRASSEVLPDVQRAAKQELCKDYHNTNTSVRVFNRELARDESLPPAIRVEAAALAPLISLMPEAIDHESWIKQRQRPSLAGIADKCGSDASLRLTKDIRLDDLQPTNYETARALITALLANTGQAIKSARAELKRSGGRLEDDGVAVIGEIRDGQIHIVVRDPLPLIADWCHEGSTTLWLHRDLQALGGAGLSQHPVDEGDPNAGKEIRASWPVTRPALKLRDVRR